MNDTPCESKLTDTCVRNEHNTDSSRAAVLANPGGWHLLPPGPSCSQAADDFPPPFWSSGPSTCGSLHTPPPGARTCPDPNG